MREKHRELIKPVRMTDVVGCIQIIIKILYNIISGVIAHTYVNVWKRLYYNIYYIQFAVIQIYKLHEIMTMIDNITYHSLYIVFIY